MFNKNKKSFQRTRKADIIAYLEHKLNEMENKLEQTIKGKKKKSNRKFEKAMEELVTQLSERKRAD